MYKNFSLLIDSVGQTVRLGKCLFKFCADSVCKLSRKSPFDLARLMNIPRFIEGPSKREIRRKRSHLLDPTPFDLARLTNIPRFIEGPSKRRNPTEAVPSSRPNSATPNKASKSDP
ncbi:hypothetical protein Hanom_Chr08g00702381 [Helianthus anomalus]